MSERVTSLPALREDAPPFRPVPPSLTQAFAVRRTNPRTNPPDTDCRTIGVLNGRFREEGARIDPVDRPPVQQLTAPTCT
jgi:hypothetical protein